MSICESEENRRKLAWLVPGYILLAWFFCVLFQPLSIRNSSSSSSSSSSSGHPHNSFVTSSADRNYRVVYLNPDGAGAEAVCRTNGSVVRLRPGADSAVVVRLAPSGWYNYRPFNCSVRVEAGGGLDGVSAVVQEMDLREYEDDVRQPGGHWGSSVCLDYLEAYTQSSRVRNKLCGEWRVGARDRLTSHGPRQTLVGYCYDDRSGHSCEASTIFLNVVLDSARLPRMADIREINLRRRKGFSVVFTGYRHAPLPAPEVDREGGNVTGEEGKGEETENLCSEGEFSCPIRDFSVHSGRPHCIWDRLRCDARPNCGFLRNEDEETCGNSVLPGRTGSGGVHTWSISTMTLLIIVYLAIVLVLVLVTMVLLRWHRTLRTPLDVLAESRGLDATAVAAAVPASDHLATATAAAVAPGAPGAAPSSEAGRRTVSIIVAYRPQPQLLVNATAAAGKRTTESPPSYDSLFLNENPPNYGMLTATVDLPQPSSEGGGGEEEVADGASASAVAPDSAMIQIEALVPGEGEEGAAALPRPTTSWEGVSAAAAAQSSSATANGDGDSDGDGGAVGGDGVDDALRADGQSSCTSSTTSRENDARK